MPAGFDSNTGVTFKLKTWSSMPQSVSSPRGSTCHSPSHPYGPVISPGPSRTTTTTPRRSFLYILVVYPDFHRYMNSLVASAASSQPQLATASCLLPAAYDEDSWTALNSTGRFIAQTRGRGCPPTATSAASSWSVAAPGRTSPTTWALLRA